MNRRDFLKVLGALGLATQIPEIAQQQIEAAPLAPVTPELTSLFDGQIFRITFPDGQECSFKGIIESMVTKCPVDGLIGADVTVRPIGPMIIGPAPKGAVNYDIPIESRSTVVKRDGKMLGELTEITLPKLSRNYYDLEDGNYIAGLQRASPLTFSMVFDGDDGAQKLIDDLLKEESDGLDS